VLLAMAFKKILVWSNLSFVVPLIFAVYWSVYWYVSVVAASLLLSMLYHYSGERAYKKIDIAGAAVLITSNLILLFVGRGVPMVLIVLAVFLAALALSVYALQRRRYKLFHSLYHVLSAAVCTLCLIVYHW
jgi:hypothetical protein